MRLTSRRSECRAENKKTRKLLNLAGLSYHYWEEPAWLHSADVQLDESLAELRKQTDAVAASELSDVETMLLNASEHAWHAFKHIQSIVVK